jgi:hypothetical protein
MGFLEKVVVGVCAGIIMVLSIMMPGKSSSSILECVWNAVCIYIWRGWARNNWLTD